MKSLNRVMMMGHLAADVEIRQTKGDHLVANFPLATNRMTRAENGEKKEVVDYHRIIAWDKLGKMCGQYLVKGTAVYVEGRIINRQYDDKNAVRQYRSEIVIDDLNILSSKRQKNGSAQVGLESVPGVSEEESKEDLPVAV